MRPTKPFTAITDRILFDDRITPIDLKVYMMICQPAYGKKNFSFLSQETMAGLCDCTRPYLNKIIKRLSNYGYIQINRNGRGQNNVYIIAMFDASDTSSVIRQRKEEVKRKISMKAALMDDVHSKLHSDVSGGVYDGGKSVNSSRDSVVSGKLQEALQEEAGRMQQQALQSSCETFQKTKSSTDSKNESVSLSTDNIGSDEKKNAGLLQHNDRTFQRTKSSGDSKNESPVSSPNEKNSDEKKESGASTVSSFSLIDDEWMKDFDKLFSHPLRAGR